MLPAARTPLGRSPGTRLVAIATIVLLQSLQVSSVPAGSRTHGHGVEARCTVDPSCCCRSFADYRTPAQTLGPIAPVTQVPLEAASKCPEGCHEHGTCNEEIGR